MWKRIAGAAMPMFRKARRKRQRPTSRPLLKFKPKDADAATRLKALEGKAGAPAGSPAGGAPRPGRIDPGLDFLGFPQDGNCAGLQTGNCFDTRTRAASLPTLFAGTKRSQGRVRFDAALGLLSLWQEATGSSDAPFGRSRRAAR